MNASTPVPPPSGTFVEVMEVGGEWFVRVVADGRETIKWFQSKSRALECAERWRQHLKLDKIDLF